MIYAFCAFHCSLKKQLVRKRSIWTLFTRTSGRFCISRRKGYISLSRKSIVFLFSSFLLVLLEESKVLNLSCPAQLSFAKY